jgi:hypothetical protein
MGTFPKVPPLHLEINLSSVKRWYLGERPLIILFLN